MGLVHNGIYPLYCEAGRTHVCEQLGMPYHEMEKDGYFLLVAEIHGRYKAPARYGDRIYIRTALTRLGRRLMVFEYEIRHKGSDDLIYVGSTKHVVTHGSGGATSLPDTYWEMLSKGLN